MERCECAYVIAPTSGCLIYNWFMQVYSYILPFYVGINNTSERCRLMHCVDAFGISYYPPNVKGFICRGGSIFETLAF